MKLRHQHWEKSCTCISQIQQQLGGIEKDEDAFTWKQNIFRPPVLWQKKYLQLYYVTWLNSILTGQGHSVWKLPHHKFSTTTSEFFYQTYYKLLSWHFYYYYYVSWMSWVVIHFTILIVCKNSFPVMLLNFIACNHTCTVRLESCWL